VAGSVGTVYLRWDDQLPGSRRFRIRVAVLACGCGCASSPCGPEGRPLSAWHLTASGLSKDTPGFHKLLTHMALQTKLMAMERADAVG
jgi:hypothetical protein